MIEKLTLQNKRSNEITIFILVFPDLLYCCSTRSIVRIAGFDVDQTYKLMDYNSKYHLCSPLISHFSGDGYIEHAKSLTGTIIRERWSVTS